MEPYLDKLDRNTYYSYIFVCNNVLTEGIESYFDGNQKLRSITKFEALFIDKAKLTIVKQYGPFKLDN